jgi:hypothetical protein
MLSLPPSGLPHQFTLCTDPSSVGSFFVLAVRDLALDDAGRQALIEGKESIEWKCDREEPTTSWNVAQ